ncbi:MAG TPA: carboxylating nicotinate-nucleotide diphosphorylase [Hyphomicrobiales bacterium]|nr:carboxylating nicotinate-nucleotide diphosphorylase [Hyphomicrobiales bacterium]
MQELFYFTGLQETVATALAEDIGSGDITAQLVPPRREASAVVRCREAAVICGRPWVDEVFRQVDPHIVIAWHVDDGDKVKPDAEVFTIHGKASSLLTAERTALNFLQTLSGVATTAREYADLVAHTHTRILDTRKTLPGLRLAQKYAVSKGGCHNHRIGLFDAYLIKENHISACGGIAAAVHSAQHLNPGRPVEVEVENLEQLHEALDAGADIVMLDNFSLEQIRDAVARAAGRVKLEASGGYSRESLVAVAETGVDYVSIGALTKHVRATDFSMRFRTSSSE